MIWSHYFFVYVFNKLTHFYICFIFAFINIQLAELRILTWSSIHLVEYHFFGFIHYLWGDEFVLKWWVDFWDPQQNLRHRVVASSERSRRAVVNYEVRDRLLNLLSAEHDELLGWMERHTDWFGWCRHPEAVGKVVVWHRPVRRLIFVLLQTDAWA